MLLSAPILRYWKRSKAAGAWLVASNGPLGEISMMQAVVLEDFGAPDVLRLVERPLPEPAPGEVLVEVAACGVCGHDILQRQGTVAPNASLGTIPGHEIAGIVRELGPGVEGFAVGD